MRLRGRLLDLPPKSQREALPQATLQTKRRYGSAEDGVRVADAVNCISAKAEPSSRSLEACIATDLGSGVKQVTSWGERWEFRNS